MSYSETKQCTNCVMWTFNVEAFCGNGHEPNIMSPSCWISPASFFRH